MRRMTKTASHFVLTQDLILLLEEAIRPWPAVLFSDPILSQIFVSLFLSKSSYESLFILGIVAHKVDQMYNSAAPLNVGTTKRAK